MKKVLCLGELLLRLSPAANGEWLRSNNMPVFMGGAELNVATALAVWEMQVKYFTALPDNNLSKDIAAYLQQKNIDTSPVVYKGDRVGLYYLQQGTDMKSSGTVFDRVNSSFATLATGLVDWDAVLKDVSWLHFSAIAPALSQSAVQLCKEALVTAAGKNITISVDLNYRAPLWKYGKQPSAVMPELVQYCDVVMGNIWAANTLLGIPLEPGLIEKRSRQAFLEHATITAQRIQAAFPTCKTIANTYRFDEGGGGIRYYATLNAKGQQYVSPEFTTPVVVDKVGSGDCFMAGLIYGIVSGDPEQDIINYAAAAAFGKLQEKGDTTNNSVATIQNIIRQHG